MTKEQLIAIIDNESKKCHIPRLDMIDSFKSILPRGDRILGILKDIEKEIKDENVGNMERQV